VFENHSQIFSLTKLFTGTQTSLLHLAEYQGSTYMRKCAIAKNVFR